FAWGSDFFGELGNGEPVVYKQGEELVEKTVLTPTKIKLDKKIIAVATGRGASYTLTEDGILYSFGSNDVGQLGIADKNIITSSNPLKVAIPKKIKMIASGDFHALALAEDGTLYSWGYNSRNGKGSTVGIGSSEKVVYDPKTLDIPGEITSISAGNLHTWVMIKDGIYAWGSNHYGQIKSGLPEYIDVPTKIEF
ncbi:MAG: RCC1 domain-containing protein, partial [Bacillota bacterium]